MNESPVHSQNQMDTLINIRGLSRSFGAVEAVKNVELSIVQGEIFGLVGPDGAGKTTILRLLCGLLNPSSGTAEVSGINVHQNSDQVRDFIGYMPQRFGLYSDLSVAENLNFYADLFSLSQKDRSPLMERLLKMTRMESFTARAAGKLSGGMKQKLALSCALLHKPKVLFLDEPTNGVDPISRRDFWAILYQLVKDGVTVLVTTSYLDEAERCNRVAFMHKGSLIECDTPDELRNRFEGRFFACQCQNRPQVRKQLNDHPEIISAEPAGRMLHICFRDGLNAEELMTRLSPDIESFQAIRPSLEDVFIAMVKDTGFAGEDLGG